MRKKAVILFFFISIISCNYRGEKPDDLIGEGKFKKIILALELYQNSNKKLKGNKLDYAKVNAAIFQENKVSPEQFKKSLEYYLINDNVYERILREISDSLSAAGKKEEKKDIIKK